jgi:diguanylate cyclase (GGDEF)-like protein/PAS domain S-box-containing protein
MTRGCRLLFRFFLSFCLLYFASLHCWSDQAGTETVKKKVVLQLKWKHQFQFAGFYAALKEGYYADAGVDVEIRSVDFERSASEVVLSGDAQYGISDSSLVLARLQGKPIVVLAAIFQHSPLVLVSKESSNILSPLELSGKRIMYQRNVDDAVLTAMFSEVGLTEDNHIHVPHSFQDAALMEDQVDAMSAYITDQPYFFKEKNIPVNIIAPANYGIDFYGDMIFTEEKYLRTNKQQVMDFRDASIKGWSYAIAHPEEMVDWIIKTYQPEKTREHLLYEAENTIRLIQPKLVEVGYFSVNRFNRISDIYKKLGLAEADSDLDGINYLDYLETTPLLESLYALYAGLAVALLVAAGLWIYSSRLKAQIAMRSEALNKAREEIGQHLQVLDNYVISSVVDREGRFVQVSKAFCQVSGFSAQELLGKKYEILVGENSAPVADEAMRSVLDEQIKWSGEILLHRKDNSRFWLMMEAEAVIGPAGKVVGGVAIGNDITDHKRIEKLSRTDQLTKLYNRHGLDEIYQQAAKVAGRYKNALSVIVFDIDNFKPVNDNYGHAEGDRVLKRIAKIVAENIRIADSAGRWGGEEFIVICPETDLQGAWQLAEKLRLKIAAYPFENLPAQSCSFGIAQRQDNESYESLMSRADGYLYKAKAKGKNCTEGLEA